MKRFLIQISLYSFFALVFFFLGTEASRLAELPPEDWAVWEAQEDQAAERMTVDQTEQLSDDGSDEKDIFSQAGAWLDDSVSDGLLYLLGKIFP